MDGEENSPHPPVFKRCECVLLQDILQNVDRALTGLSKAPVVPSSPLMGFEEKSLLVTAGEEFLAHLRHVAVRKPVTWSLKVVSDAELVTSWLASVALRGEEILDADAHSVSTRFISIPDLVIPPDLVVIRMGIKVARNAAAPEVLAEAVQSRWHESKPTWIWEEPLCPLGPGNMFWSDTVGRIIRPWPSIKNLDPPGRDGEKKARKPTEPVKNGSGKKSLRGGSS